MTEQNYRGGTLRYTDKNGEVRMAEPGTYWYSTLTMVAQECFDAETQQFIRIFEDEDDEMADDWDAKETP